MNDHEPPSLGLQFGPIQQCPELCGRHVLMQRSPEAHERRNSLRTNVRSEPVHALQRFVRRVPGDAQRTLPDLLLTFTKTGLNNRYKNSKEKI